MAAAFTKSGILKALCAFVLVLLAVDVAAVRPPRVLVPQRVDRIVIRPVVSIDAAPQPEAVEGQILRFYVRLNRTGRERTVIGYRVENLAQFRRTLPAVVIEAGQTEAEITIPTLDDELLNGDRNVVVTLVAVSDNATLGSAQATGIIRDNERPPVPTAYIEAAPAPSVMEGETLIFTVRLRAAVTQRTIIRYSVSDHDDAAGGDTEGRLTIAAGSTDAYLRIPTDDDSAVNGERTLQVQLETISGNGEFGVATVQGIVLDNDKSPANPNISILSNGGAVEGEELTFTVFADSALPETRRIPIRISAPENSLIEPIPSSVLLRAGEISTMLTLLTADDAAPAEAREVSVELMFSEDMPTDSTQAVATAIISDNDENIAPTNPGNNGGSENVLGDSEAPSLGSGGAFWTSLTGGPLPALVLGVLILIAGVAAVRRFILPRFYKVSWAMGVPHDVDAVSSGTATLLPPSGGVEIELGAGEALIVGPCPIISEEERDDPDLSY